MSTGLEKGRLPPEVRGHDGGLGEAGPVREGDLDVEAAARLRAGGERGFLGCVYRLHVREAEPDAVALVVALDAEALEGPEYPLDLALGDRRAAVRDRQDCPPCSRACGDVDAAVRDVVAERIVEQIRDQPLREARIASGLGRLESRLDVEAPLPG